MQRLFYLAGVITTAAFATLAVASADAPSKRHLVYSFTVGVQSDQHQATSMLERHSDPGQSGSMNSGDSTQSGTASDKGQITVDYGGVEADGGLVVTIAETARTNRTALPNTCVVYANTNIICGTGTTNPEELAIIRTLSPKFFDPSALDANRHWHVGSEAAGVSIDFTAKPAASGMTIDSQRTEKARSGDTVSATASYDYDTAKRAPTSLKEYTQIREQSMPGQYMNVITDITATLLSDSGAKS